MAAVIFITLKQKPLHGQFPCQIESVTRIVCAHKWLANIELHEYVILWIIIKTCQKNVNTVIQRSGSQWTWSFYQKLLEKKMLSIV